MQFLLEENRRQGEESQLVTGAAGASGNSVGGIRIDEADIEQIDAQEVAVPVAVFGENRQSRQVFKKAEYLYKNQKFEKSFGCQQQGAQHPSPVETDLPEVASYTDRKSLVVEPLEDNRQQCGREGQNKGSDDHRVALVYPLRYIYYLFYSVVK
uniref:Uncharacterized protein n=1 Tax=Romanomermis culicivorax TaxID=13658 RepID=A0A915JIF2_ROMCU